MAPPPQQQQDVKMSGGGGEEEDEEAAGEVEGEEGEEDDTEAQMRAMLGIGGFGTTKQKKVKGNDVGAISKNTTVKYRQYMYVCSSLSVDWGFGWLTGAVGIGRVGLIGRCHLHRSRCCGSRRTAMIAVLLRRISSSRALLSLSLLYDHSFPQNL